MTDDRPRHGDEQSGAPDEPTAAGEPEASDREAGDLDDLEARDREAPASDADREVAAQMAQDPADPGLGAADETEDVGDAPEPNEPA
ncbi:MAG: hypothetical protein ACLFXM_04760 [Acidimicrobiia bacterium]